MGGRFSTKIGNTVCVTVFQGKKFGNTILDAVREYQINIVHFPSISVWVKNRSDSCCCFMLMLLLYFLEHLTPFPFMEMEKPQEVEKKT